MTRLVLFLAFLFPTQSAFSQPRHIKAKAFYYEAQKQFDNGNYGKCISHLDRVERYLKKTNPRILNLKIKAYYLKKDYKGSKESIYNFSRYKYQAKTDLRNETERYISKIKENLSPGELSYTPTKQRSYSKPAPRPTVKKEPVKKPKPKTYSNSNLGVFNLSKSTSLRSRAKSSSSVITRLKGGTKLTVLEKTNKYWWKVNYEGSIGYVKAAYLK